ncbi:protein WVD2-like 7 isoform X1 [Arachis stenosperma]|uniref:protein WVD2-like 7 isoform X1 n=1 Tax=Arachis stenosperma TaxID=217475 RepID=UPI0025AD5FAA|nr:protein WVD2-like 7 isoform X1 [Arachis stenosperma]
MGDSTCLMQMQQPFCYASGIINEANERNPIHALGQSSVSFGRFMSESLAWEKWSSFSHNRYVEEAERFSRPGSVAQKKAFFEAHYKKLAAQKAAAAALLEQANNAAPQNNNEDEHVDEVANNDVAQNNAIDDNSERRSSSTRLVVKEEQDSIISANGNYSVSDLEASSTILPQSNKVKEAVSKMEEEPLVGNSMKIELQSQNEDAEKILETTPIMTPLLKQGSRYDQEILPSVSKKKPPVSSFKLLKSNATSKVASTPIKSTATTLSSKRDNCNIAATPTSSSNKHASLLSSADKRRSTPYKSVNFTPIRELNRLTASVMKKFESARASAGSSKASKDASLTPLRTPTMAYKKEMQMHSALTPLTEKKRNKTPLDLSSTGKNTASSKWRLLSTENKMRSPMISSPFSLRTEERAARRKKKLEEKFNANEAQKVQLHTKLKEKAETEIRKLRQSFCFKARPLPDFYKERKESNKETQKDPQIQSESRKATPHSQRPYNGSGTIKNFQEKTQRRTFAHHLSTTLENTSPNIQQGNLKNRNHKQ